MNDECRIMHALRDAPELFDRIAQSQSSELALQEQLRRDYPDDLVRAAVSLHELRLRAASKFTRAHQMWFDRLGLEQSTNEAVARYKSTRFSGTVWDLCCGIGGDSLALAAHCDVTGIDINPAACLRTQWNAQVYGVANRVTTECREVPESSDWNGLVHIDPDRRPGSSGRVSRIEDYVPGLEFLRQLMSRCRGGAIKLSPASNFGGKFAEVEIELISYQGECKEATIWFGELAREIPFRATVLPAGETIAGHPLEVAVPITPLGRFVYDPDPAVVRSGLVDVVADRLQLTRLDGAEEYLTSDQLVRSPFVQAFETVAELPNNERQLKEWVRSAGIGQLEIKCRHLPVKADELRRRLKLSGKERGVAIFARLASKARIIACHRCT